MQKNLVRNEQQALLYLTDCLLATVSNMSIQKSRKKYEYERHIQIAQTAVEWVDHFVVNIQSNSRVHEVLNCQTRTVKEWASKYEA